MLRNSPILYTLTDENFAEILKRGQPCTFKKGTVLVKEGEPNDSLVVIGQGQLVISVNEVKVAVIEAGGCIGEGGLVKESNGTFRLPNATVVAQTECHAFKVSHKDILEYMQTQPGSLESVRLLIRQNEDCSACIQALVKADVFADCSTDFFMALASRLEHVSVEKGGKLMSYGAQDQEGMFFVASGMVDISDNKGHLALLGPGKFFGEMMLLAGSTRSATALAAEDCELYQLKRPSFLRLVTTYPKAMDSIKKLAKARSIETMARKSVLRRRE